MQPGDTPSIQVVTQVASAEGIDPVELTPPLHNVVDPDALDAFVQTADAEATIEFSYRDHSVCVDGTGRVVLTQRTEPPATPE
ncbi:HalOD1 output domain-containing protein [Natrarchaeobaculum sulfurireducens]|uniref:Halobacterial output domain-containing protein n=1 Tax=Natrarchaeobaculum sulfurireducens TaxID=2044521 RepID=A0A346PEU6_9EURY|nr:HalOD1 output domain-containing protein [Natrarchaeobaculum sulfurireducens]AXR78041.1 hypothetical protein AArc1_1713 [Natrarchaeobaculum sulfurireducens]